jgi:putative transposase
VRDSPGRDRVSKRRACLVLGQSRSTHRLEPHVTDDEPRLVSRMVVLGTQYGRYGYRRITALLRSEDWVVNLQEKCFLSVDDSRQKIEAWRHPETRVRGMARIKYTAVLRVAKCNSRILRLRSLRIRKALKNRGELDILHVISFWIRHMR